MFPQIEHRPALKTGLVGMELETRDIRFETGDISFEIGPHADIVDFLIRNSFWVKHF